MTAQGVKGVKELKEIVNKGMFRGSVKYNEPLSAYTSIKIGGPVDVMVFPEDPESLKNVLVSAGRGGIPFFVVGAGTNILIKDGGVQGIAISLKSFEKIERIRNIGEITRGSFPATDPEDLIVLFVEAGVLLGNLINVTKKNGYSGIEALAGIPGTIGGAVSMNAGSFGTEIKDVIVSVALMRTDGEIAIMEKDTLAFSYRNSNIPNNTIILSASIVLKKDNPEHIGVRIKEFLRQRKGTQPAGESSAGCIFKNPKGNYAGRLIDAAGCKGMGRGDAAVSSVHANYFINKNAATSKDVIELMEAVKERVSEFSGILLEPEIRIIGRDG